MAFRNTYIEEGPRVTLVVNTDATRRREEAAFVPFGIYIANNGGGSITVDRESLTMLDDTGRRYPMATVAEAKSLGNLAVQDLRASRSFFDLIIRRRSGQAGVQSVFFPIRIAEGGPGARGLVRDTVELSRGTWMADVIYFPHPEGRLLERRYELWLKPRELDKAVFVRFAVY